MNLKILKHKKGYVIMDVYSRLYLCKDGTWSEAINQAKIFLSDIDAQYTTNRLIDMYKKICTCTRRIE